MPDFKPELGGRRGQRAVAGDAEWGEGRGVWGSHLPSDRHLGEGSIHLGLKTKEKQPQIPLPHVF